VQGCQRTCQVQWHVEGRHGMHENALIDVSALAAGVVQPRDQDAVAAHRQGGLQAGGGAGGPSAGRHLQTGAA
jgi:hypothetical protein